MLDIVTKVINTVFEALLRAVISMELLPLFAAWQLSLAPLWRKHKAGLSKSLVCFLGPASTKKDTSR